MSDSRETPHDHSPPATTDRSERALAILVKALELEPEERQAFVDAACEGDVQLADEVAGLLRADARGHELDRSALELTALELTADQAGPGQILERYRLVDEIGVGGMSRVFLAERIDGSFEQRVAIKVLLPFLGDSGDRQRRFAAERQILATLQHPAIAQLLDGGVAPGGQPYLVMEYIDGRPITEHCRAENLGLEDRLALFREVCEAVSTAHRRLIIHRDLKPSNVLVTAEGQVKLLDFGIAKAIEGDTAAVTPRTQTGLFLMTPEYAAPEQLRGEPVSTSTDVYGLGLLLYELLTGCRPFATEGRRASEIEHLVCATDPAPPSSVAEEPGIVASELRGDLDAILLKALRKEPEERYASVRELSEDLLRFVSGRPILARPPTLRYVAAKAVRRHRWPMIAAAGFLVAGGLGLAATLHQAGEAARQRDAALRESTNARREATRAERVSDFTLELFKTADPSHSQDLTARQMLRDGVDRVDELDDEPIVQAEILAVMAAAFLRLGEFESAEALYRRQVAIHQSLGPPTVELANAMAGLGEALDRRGEAIDEARALFDQAIAIDRTLPDQGGGDAVLHQLRFAAFEMRWGDLDRAQVLAEETLERARELGRQAEAAQLLSLLGAMSARQRDFARAADYFSEELEETERLHGLDHPDAANALHNLGFIALRIGDLEKAAGYLQRAIAVKRRILPENHTSTAASLTSLGDVCTRLERFDEAEQHLDEARLMKEASFGQENVELIPVVFQQGQLARARGHLEEAADYYRSLLEIAEPTLGPYGYRQSRAWEVLGEVQIELHRPSEAIHSLRQAATSYESEGREARAIPTLRRLGEVQLTTGDRAGAIASWTHALERAQRQLEPDDEELLEIQRRLDALGETPGGGRSGR